MSTSEPEPLPADALRASDADRQKVVDRLQEAFTEGRLDLTELDERTAGAYAAKTVGDLKPFTVDLPAPGTRSVPTPPKPVEKKSSVEDAVDRLKAGVAALPSWVMPLVGVIVAINVVGWVFASMSHGAHGVFPWWIFLIIIWVAGGRAHHRQRHEDRRQQQQRRRPDNDWYDRYHRRSRGQYDSRYRDRDNIDDD